MALPPTLTEVHQIWVLLPGGHHYEFNRTKDVALEGPGKQREGQLEVGHCYIHKDVGLIKFLDDIIQMDSPSEHFLPCFFCRMVTSSFCMGRPLTVFLAMAPP